jgi:membrane protein implicated in regulation of membrane protease activity
MTAHRVPSRWTTWRRSRPFVGGLLVALGGLEMFLSSQLDLGNIHVQLGIEGLQATIIPIVLVLLGALIIAMPAHRIFYGIIALAVALYSLVGVNLGGFLLGMLLSTVGGIVAVSWAPKPETDAAVEGSEPSSEEPSDETERGDDAKLSRDVTSRFARSTTAAGGEATEENR